MDHKAIGLRIETRRKELELTLAQVAGEINVAPSTIQRYEKGNFDKIKMPVIEAIASVLQVNPAWIIGKTDDAMIYDENGIPVPFDYRPIVRLNHNDLFRLSKRYGNSNRPRQPLTPEELADRERKRSEEKIRRERERLAVTLVNTRPEIEALLRAAEKATSTQVEAAIAMLMTLSTDKTT